MKRAIGAVALAGLLSLGLAACSSGGAPSGSTGSTTTRPEPVDTQVQQAVTAYLTHLGIPSDRYRITELRRSTVDPDWATYGVGPTPTDQATFQAAYGFVHRTGGEWRVTGFGSAEVGCPLGNRGTDKTAVTYVVVPAPVLKGFGFACPPSS